MHNASNLRLEMDRLLKMEGSICQRIDFEKNGRIHLGTDLLGTDQLGGQIDMKSCGSYQALITIFHSKLQYIGR